MTKRIFGIFICVSFITFIISLIFGILLSHPTNHTTDYDLNFWTIFMRNLLVCAILIVGFFSLGIISLILLSINSGIFGAVFTQYYDETSFVNFIFSVLPHGIFEVPALIISTAIGISSWLYVFQYVLNHKIRIKNDYYFYLKSIGLVIILLIIGAFIETFITLPLSK
ncbi:stage II sporulation protein M [Staphylococcus xylosus]|uniref:stage II sporulation protein M n=1 Tax=Staphylococcus xylosus TaxID=1288 RepID=UPI003F54A04E